MPAPWDPFGGREESWSDREAWRGDVHREDDESWRGASESQPWEAPEGDEFFLADVMEEEHPSGWPEDLAGPEYWLFKRLEPGAGEGLGGDD